MSILFYLPLLTAVYSWKMSIEHAIEKWVGIYRQTEAAANKTKENKRGRSCDIYLNLGLVLHKLNLYSH